MDMKKNKLKKMTAVSSVLATPKTKVLSAQLKKTAVIKKFWIGFDLGGTKMMAVAVDEKNKVLASARKATHGDEGVQKGKVRILKLIEEVMALGALDKKGLQGIGMGCPGLVNPAQGILLSAPNLGWNKVNFKLFFKQHYGVDSVVLNDVDAGTYGEYFLGTGDKERSVLGVFPGTGLGAGFVHQGRLLMGRHLSAMELGMIYLPGTHLGSSLPGAVLLEDLTSRLALAAQASIACHRGQLPELNKKSQGNLRDIRSKALAATILSGQPAAVMMMDQSLEYLAMGVALTVNLLAPDEIVLGGGLVEEMHRKIMTDLKSKVKKYALPELTKSIKYRVATLGGQAVALGAMAWFRQGSKIS
jgi:glucokinase